jgi:hypothetical protein
MNVLICYHFLLENDVHLHTSLRSPGPQILGASTYCSSSGIYSKTTAKCVIIDKNYLPRCGFLFSRHLMVPLESQSIWLRKYLNIYAVQ